MPKKNAFKTGLLRQSEWSGFWKANANDPPMTGEEWDEKWESLNDWLGKQYNLEPIPVRKRQCYVVDDYAEPERMLQIEIEYLDIFTRAFLQYVQEWLRAKAPLWRVAIPTDDTDKNLVFVYPQGIRINPEAEADLDGFIERIKPAFQAAIKKARLAVGIEW